MPRRYWFPLLVMLLCLPSLLVAGQESSGDVHPLSLSSGAGARIFPSPDARLAAYDSNIRLDGHADRFLTISTVAPGDEPAYYDKPEDLPRGFEADASSFYVPFAWSPDSSRLAVTGQPLVTLTDTDLWVFDVASESWTNLADDGYSGSLTGEGGGLPAPGTIIDVQPAWSPDGTMIAVERTVIDDAGQFGQAQLTLIDAQTGSASSLAPVPGTSSTGATTALDWSRDGKTLALTVLHHDPDMENDGVWLVDVSSGDTHQLATLAQTEAALHSVLADLEMTSIGPLFWSPDGSRLLLWVGKTEGTPVQVWPFLIDAATGAITPVPIPSHPRDTATSRGLRPLQAAWSPDGSQLMVYTFGLHPDEDTTSLDPANTSVRGAVRVIDVATGENHLIGYLPLGKTPLYYAAWAPDGQVVIDGYHLALQETGTSQ